MTTDIPGAIPGDIAGNLAGDITGDIVGAARLLRLRDGIYADDLVLAAIVRLDLLTVAAEQPGTLDDLCRRNGIARRPADVLCTLLRAMELLEPGETLRPTPLARATLIRGAPFDLRPYLASAASRSTCLDQANLLRTGQPAAWTGGAAGRWPHDPMFGEFLAGARARARVVTPALMNLLKDLPVSSVLVMNTSRDWNECAARHGLDVRVTSLDHRAVFEPLPNGYDGHVLSHVLHCWAERTVQRIVGRSFDALPDGGWIVVHDTHLNPDKTGPLAVARYSALLLHATEGQCWSSTEVERFLADAGFVDIHERPCGVDRTAILARRPGGRSRH